MNEFNCLVIVIYDAFILGEKKLRKLVPSLLAATSVHRNCTSEVKQYSSIDQDRV